jgi:hypothetical protein
MEMPAADLTKVRGVSDFTIRIVWVTDGCLLFPSIQPPIPRISMGYVAVIIKGDLFVENAIDIS